MRITGGMGKRRDKIRQLWRENWILRRIKKFLPKDQSGRMKGEFSMGDDLMDSIFYKDENGNVIQQKKKRFKR